MSPYHNRFASLHGTSRFGRRRLLAGAGAVSTATLLAAACGSSQEPGASSPAAHGDAPAGQPRPGGTLTAVWESDIGPLDNNRGWGAVTNRVTAHIFDNLVMKDYTVKPDPRVPTIPGLAESWETTDDGLQYTFKLRQGVKFHDGTPFNAEAVKFNFDRNMTKEFQYYHAPAAGPIRRYTKAIDKIEIPGPNTVVMKLNTIEANFINYMTNSLLMIGGPDAIAKAGNDDFGQRPVGTGAFKFVEREKGVKTVLEKNPEYWQGAPYLDRIIVRPISEPVARVTALQTGEVDWINVVHPDYVDVLKANPKFTVVMEPYPHIWGFYFNWKNPTFKDKRVREALNMAIDRDGLSKNLLKGVAIPATQWASPGTLVHDSELKGFPYDPAGARQRMVAAGVPDGFETTFRFPVDGSGQIIPVPMMEYISENLRKNLNVRLKLETYEWQSYIQMRSKGAEDGVGGMFFSFSLDEGWEMEGNWVTESQAPNGLNLGWYSNPQVDQLVARAAKTLDEPERVKIYRQAQRIGVLDDVAWLLVVHDTEPKAYRKELQHFVRPPAWVWSYNKVWFSK